MSTPFTLHPLTSADHAWVREFLIAQWGSDRMVVHGEVFHPADLPGYAACEGERPIGLVTYRVSGDECEVVTLDSLRSGTGIGSALIEQVVKAARTARCRRVWLVTTNDNLNALRFYQKRGFELVAVRRGAVDLARQIKPEIPLLGEHGIPIRDELELEMRV